MYQYNFNDDQAQDPHHRQPQLFDDTSPGGYQQYQEQGYGGQDFNGGYNYNPNSYSNVPPQQQQQQHFVPQQQAPFQPSFQPQPNSAPFGGAFPASQFIQDPLIANAAMQYGQNLVGQGQELLEKKFEKYMSVSKLKYYFAVDTQYVMRKIKLIFFPFTHSDWSVQFEQGEGVQVQPRHDVNAPDLYIPTMAFVTYILMAGLSLGLMDRFSPEALGIQASTAVFFLLLELACVLGALYFNAGAVVRRSLHPLHVLALAGYKYPGMIVMLGAGILLPGTGYYGAQLYCSASLALFMFRTLRSQIQSAPGGADEKYGSGGSSYSEGSKRRFYLLLVLTLMQPFWMWWLTKSVVYYQASLPAVPAAL